MAEANEDMFGVTQDQDSDQDDTYTLAASEIAVSKIRLEQKKEKTRALVANWKKIIEERKRAAEERDRLKQEIAEVQLQKGQKVNNLKILQETQVSLEAALEDLTLKVNAEEAETKSMAARFQAEIKDAEETLESYLEVYRQFPLAVKAAEKEAELKNVQKQLELTKNTIQDTKNTQKRFHKIKRQRQHAWAVNLAKLYCDTQEKISENRKLQERKKELIQLIEDIKSGKIANVKKAEPPKSFLQPHVPKEVTTVPKRLEFKMPRFQINSPPPVASSENSKTKRGVFNWETLLGGMSFASKSQHKRQDDPKLTSQTQKVLAGSRMEIDIDETQVSINRSHSNIQTLMQVPQMDTSNAKVQANLDTTGGAKRKPIESIEKKINQPRKKIAFQLSGVNKISDSSVKHCSEGQKTNKKETQQEQVQHTASKELFTNSNTVNKENLQPTDGCNINRVRQEPSQYGNKLISSIMKKQKAISGDGPGGNLTYSLSMKQKEVQQQKFVGFPKSSAQINSATADYNTKKNTNTYNQMENNENEIQPEEGMLMNPTSPPDLVPVGNNSQPLSQPKQNSQLSDFNSPIELNEKGMEIYKKLQAESPGSMYDISPMKEDVQKERVVKSKYFLDVNSASKQSQEGELNTPDVAGGAEHGQSPKGGYQESGFSSPMNSPLPSNLGGYQELVFSPPMNYYSPPLGNTGTKKSDQADSVDKTGFDFGGAKQGNKSPEGAFSFNFGSGPSKTSSSVFSLF